MSADDSLPVREVEVVPALVDLRLVPAALAAWTTTWAVTGRSAPSFAAALVAVIAGGGAIGLGLHWARRHREEARHALTPYGSARLGLALVCAVIAANALTGAVAGHGFVDSPANRAAEAGRLVTLTVRLREDPTPKRDAFSSGATVGCDILSATSIDGTGSGGGARLYASGAGWSRFARGDVVEVRGVIDASFHADPPWVGTVRAGHPRLIARPGGWRAAVRSIRADLVNAVSGLDDQGRALVPGMAIGDDRAMSRDLADAMRATSLTHLTAVSGSHMAIVLGVVAMLVPNRRVRPWAVAVVVALMVAVVGPEPSVVRAAATAGVGVIGMATRRGEQGIAALSAVVILVLLIDPWAAREAGFALSAAATFGVVGPAAAVVRWSKDRLRGDTRAGRAARRLVGVAAIPVMCQAMTLPILFALVGRIPTYGVLANIVAAPAVAPATLLALAATLTAPFFPSAASALARLASLFTGWVAGVAQTMARWPGASPQVEAPTLWALAVLVVLVLAWIAVRGRRSSGRCDAADAGGP